MRRWIRNLMVISVGAAGCRPGAAPPASTPQADNLPPAYSRNLITDPQVAGVAKAFHEWADQQQAQGQPLFGRVEVLPPLPTLEPYGIGTYEKVPRLPVILTTGPGWATLTLEQREALTAKVFQDLSEQLSAIKTDPPLRPTVTIQTPQGLELAWVNTLVPGRRLLHGDGE
ncbi:MAG: hypothetical protein LC104_04675 [Bacteroidales bacterium]|nr:hypothetical protein [Bacteroidales bacterium]